jgi:K+-transporting ATPase ATPase A chain
MTFAGWAQIVIFLAVLTALTPLVGGRRSFQPSGFRRGPGVAGVAIIYASEAHGSPAMHAAGLHGANLQDKEQRFGTASSALFAETGTASGDGAVNSGLEAYTGVASAVAMSNIMTGEVIFGGPGSGLFGMLLLVVLGVFIAGLMVGRTPEYLGKRLGMREVKLAALGTVFVPTSVLAMTAVANATSAGRQSLSNKGPLGFSESLYAYLSQANNNGSALATRRVTPVGLGTLRTDTPTFVIFVIGFVIIFALLNFLAALAWVRSPRG